VVEGNVAGLAQYRVEYSFMAADMDVTCPDSQNKTIDLTIIGIDLDVDSDNTVAASDFAPDRDANEETIEDDPALTGRIIRVNTDDDDGDGITDLGDGYNLDCSDGTCA